MTDELRCAQCDHASEDHVLVATTADQTGERADPFQGGIRLCPESDCQCYATWGMPLRSGGSDRPTTIPSDQAIVALRSRIQAKAVLRD